MEILTGNHTSISGYISITLSFCDLFKVQESCDWEIVNTLTKRNTNPVTIKSKSDRLLGDTRLQWYFIDLIWFESVNRYCCTATFTEWYYIMADRCVLILPLVFFLKRLIFITFKFYRVWTPIKHLFKIIVCPLQQNAVESYTLEEEKILSQIAGFLNCIKQVLLTCICTCFNDLFIL